MRLKLFYLTFLQDQLGGDGHSLLYLSYYAAQHRKQYWLGGVMVAASDLRSTGRGFDSQPFRYQVATLGKLFTHMCLCQQAVQFGTGQTAVMLCGREGNP